MSTVRISWSGELTEEQGEILNNVFNLMGLYGLLDQCNPEDIPKVKKEIEELEAKLDGMV